MHLRFLLALLQEHDLDSHDTMSGEYMWRRIEILTECTGEFDVLQSENGDKSTGVVWSTRSAMDTPE